MVASQTGSRFPRKPSVCCVSRQRPGSNWERTHGIAPKRAAVDAVLCAVRYGATCTWAVPPIGPRAKPWTKLSDAPV